MQCRLKHITGDRYECEVCGHTVLTRTPDRTYTICPGRPIGPSIVQQAIHYVSAVAGHVADGLQCRTDAEVASLLAICQSCEFFDAAQNRCTICGCRCTTGSTALTNKLRMASQKCPKGKWD